MIGDFVYLAIGSLFFYHCFASIKTMMKRELFKNIFVSICLYILYVFIYSIPFRISYLVSNQYFFKGDVIATILSAFTIFVILFSSMNYADYLLNLCSKRMVNYAILYSVIPQIFLLMLSIIMCHFHNKFNVSIFIMIFMFMNIFKICGNFLTKVGDIVGDYDTKIVKKEEEDKKNSVFSFIDNIGDNIGDLFGIYVDYINMLMLCMIMMYTTNSFVVFYHLFFFDSVFGKIVVYLTVMSLGMLIYGENFFFRYTDIIFLLSIAVSNILYMIKVIANLGLNISALKNILFLDVLNVSIFFVASLSIYLLSAFNFYEKLAICFIKLASRMPIMALTMIFSSGFIFSYLFINYIHFANKVIFSTICANINVVSFLNYFVLFGLYYVFKTTFGGIVDSSCGFFKKMFYSSENREEDCKKAEDIENILEHYDHKGNVFKFETKLFFIYITYVIYEIISFDVYKSVIYNDFLVLLPVVLTMIFMCACYFLYGMKEETNCTYSRVIHYAIRHASIFFYISTNIIFAMMFINPEYMRFIHSGMMYLFLLYSCLFYFLGSMFDIIKKHIELNTTKENVSEDIYNLSLHLDMIGDCFKDVVGPFCFSISNLLCFILIFLK